MSSLSRELDGYPSGLSQLRLHLPVIPYKVITEVEKVNDAGIEILHIDESDASGAVRRWAVRNNSPTI